MLKTSKKLLLPAAYTLYMSIGITLVMMQLFSGSFMESFGLSMTELGTLLSCQFIAGIILPIFLGNISQKNEVSGIYSDFSAIERHF